MAGHTQNVGEQEHWGNEPGPVNGTGNCPFSAERGQWRLIRIGGG